MNPLTQKESDYIINTTSPIGYVINTGPVETKTPIYDLFVDTKREDCLLVLTKWVDGKGMWLRYLKNKIVINHNQP